MFRILLVDGYNVFLRHFCVSPAMNSDGDTAGGTYGFLRELLFLAEKFKPHRIFTCWEGLNSTKRRRNLFERYKGGRKTSRLNREYENDDDQNSLDIARQLFRIGDYEQYLPEADDVISFLYKEFRDSYKVIVSSDKDLWQLIDSKCVIYRSGSKMIVNERIMKNEIGILPINWGLVKAVVGDKSDKLPGIGGVGEKTIKKLFPFISEKREYILADIIEYASERKGQGKQYTKFTLPENIKRLKDNWEIVQLYTPSINDIAKERIKEKIKVFCPIFDPIGLRRMFAEDGFTDNIRYSDKWTEVFIGLAQFLTI